MQRMLAAMALVLIGAACSPADDAGEPSDGSSTSVSTVASVTSTSPPPVSTVVASEGPIATVGLDELPVSLNPVAEGGTSPSSAIIQRASLPGALVYDPETWQVLPDLVIRIPSVDDGDVVLDRDMQEVTWTIRPEAMWSDGVPVSGDDFAFTLRATLGQTECGGRSEFTSLFGFEIMMVSEKSITVSMPGPTTGYESMFSTVLPAHVTDGDDVCSADGVGWPSAGPFVASSIGPQAVKLTRNDAYWRDPAPLAGIEFVAVDGDAGVVSGIADGSLDVGVISDAALAGEAAAAGALVTAVATGRHEHLAFDFRTGDEPSLVHLLTFRQGVARALDLDAMADRVGWLPATGVLRGVDPAAPWAIYEHDVDEARRLISLACEQLSSDCATTPPELRLLTTDFGVRPGIVERIVVDLGEAGVDVVVDRVTATGVGEAIDRGEWDIAVLGFSESPGVWQAAGTLLSALDREEFENVYAYGGPGSAAATDRSAFQLRLFDGQIGVSPDRDRVRRLLGEVHELLGREVVFIPLVVSARFSVVAADRLVGVIPNTSPSDFTWNVAEWSMTGT